MYRLMVTGDLMVGEETEQDNARVTEPVRRLIDTLHVDGVLGNLEVPLTDRGYPSDKLIYWRSPPATARELKKMGFTMLSLATNHTLDYGVEGLLDTLEILDQEQIKRAGAGRNLDEAMKPILIHPKENCKIAIFSIASTLHGNSAAGEGRPGAAPLRIRTLYEFDTKRLEERPGFPPYIHTLPRDEDVQRVCQAVQAMKKQGYAVMVAIHWGDPYQKKLAEYQRPLARAFIEVGCDIVLGHHAHTFHAIEVLKGVPVLYSAGNFIRTRRLDRISKEMWTDRNKEAWKMSSEALLGVLEFDNGSLSRVEILPIVIDENGVPELAAMEDANRILKEVDDLSRGLLRWTIVDGKGIIRMEVHP
jgi:poly-gamma-glutamate capsule biosynthesis protein CapA/YwtB (metallophosphatase superfamily)